MLNPYRSCRQWRVWSRIVSSFIGALSLLAVAACAVGLPNLEPPPMRENMYMVSSMNGLFEGLARWSAMREAEGICEKQGKVMEVIQKQTRRDIFEVRVNVWFICVDA